MIVATCAVLGFLGQAAPFTDDAGFVHIPSGKYKVGKKTYLDNPYRTVKLKAFDIAAKDVTNSDFAAFAKATNYVTDGERLHNGMVFEAPLQEFRWMQDKTATWHFPNGITRGGIEERQDHPVTAISYADAEAFCKWAGVRLPTLDEWKVASRAGTTTTYFWGEDPAQIGEYANVWHGRDHLKPDTSDGYQYTSPVGKFKPNPWGLYDIYGNVFQFCSGRLPSDRSSRTVHARGGSWWCSKNACRFYNSADIGRIDRHAVFSNLGFRVVRK
ncbi:MAG: SUMF1/EgtB/PvdO family nonheme iron enzyme [bacterium]